MKRATVPETRIKENNHLFSRENDVGFAEHRRDVFIKTQTRPPQSRTKRNFHFRVRRFHSSHRARSGFFADIIRHLVYYNKEKRAKDASKCF
jgi:hypothetical protein